MQGSKPTLTLHEGENASEYFVERLQLEPGDTLVLHFDGILSTNQAGILRDALKGGGLTVPVIILDRQMSVSVVHNVEAETLRRQYDEANHGQPATAHST